MKKIYVFFGLIASGKSTLAQRFAGESHLPYYNTDLVRKELAGLDPVTRRADGIDQGIYSKEFSAKTYQAMLDRAAADLRAGRHGVVLDGSYHRRAERERVLKMADSQGAVAVFILCTCSDDEVRRRLAKRARDPDAVSDGRWEVYQAQKEIFASPDEQQAHRLITMNTERPVEVVLEMLYKKLEKKP